MLKGIEHIGLCAEKPEKLVEWYVSVLNCEVVHSIKDRSTFFVKMPGGGLLEVYPAKSRSESASNLHSGLRHLGIAVDDFENDCDSFVRRGVKFIPEMTVRNEQMKLAFFKDPEGNLMHFVQRMEKADWQGR